MLVLLKLFFWIDLASVIQDRDTTVDLELDDFVIRTYQDRFSIGRPNEAIRLIYTSGTYRTAQLGLDLTRTVAQDPEVRTT